MYSVNNFSSKKTSIDCSRERTYNRYPTFSSCMMPLRYGHLRYASLRHAFLRDAYLRYVYSRYGYLRDAYLRDASLRYESACCHSALD